MLTDKKKKKLIKNKFKSFKFLDIQYEPSGAEIILNVNKNSKIMITGANGYRNKFNKKFVELGFSPLVLVRSKTIHNEILKLKNKVSIYVVDLSRKYKKNN